MKKIFIDCGGYDGMSVREFINSRGYDPSFIIYSFEPNPEMVDKYKDMKEVMLSDNAVWIYDGEIDFYIDSYVWGKLPSLGSTLIKEKYTGSLDREHPIKVKCIDLSKWILDTFEEEDYIILKIDIEGGEYAVLNKMIEDGSILYVNELRIDWHYKKVDMDPNIHHECLKKLEEVSLANNMSLSMKRNSL